MATAELTPEQRVQRAKDLRSRVLLGQLPDDFLRLPSTSAPGQVPLMAMDPAALQFYSFVPPNTSWNRVINAYLPNGVESLYVQIFDERSFTQDECVAWQLIPLPPAIFQGETVDDWYQLSGAMGDKQEGALNLVISFTPVTQPQVQQQAPVVQPVQQQQQPRELFTEADLEEICAMFPNIEKEVVRSVLEAKRGDKDSTVNALIDMNS